MVMEHPVWPQFLDDDDYFFYLRLRTLFSLLLREKGSEEGKRETSISCLLYEPSPEIETATQACARYWELNLQPFGYGTMLQLTEPH